MTVPKIIIDTNVVVSGLRSRQGTSYAVLQLIGKEKFDCAISVPLVLEYEKVLFDPKLKVPFTRKEIVKFLDFLCANSEHHKIYYLWRPFLKDEKDDMVLDLQLLQVVSLLLHSTRKISLA